MVEERAVEVEECGAKSHEVPENDGEIRRGARKFLSFWGGFTH
jgi:hypothetical protein